MKVRKTLLQLSIALALSVSLVPAQAQSASTPGEPVDPMTISPAVKTLFDQGAELYPELFSQPSGWFLYEGFTYRHFASSGAYVGVKDGYLYVKNGPTGELAQQGTVTETLATLHHLMLYVEGSVPHGEVTIHKYHSTALDSDRQFYVYTPPGYDADGAPYPVLYLLHGAGSTENSWTRSGLVNVIMDNLIAREGLDPFVIIMPYGYAYPPGPNDRTDPVKLREQRSGFNADFLQDVMPEAEANFNISTEQSRRAIGGLSLGGSQSLAIGFSHPELFSHVTAFSPAMGATTDPETGGVNYDDVLADTARINNALQLVFLGVGVDDTLFDSIESFNQQMSNHGIEHSFRVTQGAHTWEVWKRYFNEVAPKLFSPDNF